MSGPNTEELQKPMTRGSATASYFRRSLNRLYIATAVLYVAIIVVCIYIYASGRNTTDALCSLRNDQVERVTQSIEFLKNNPNGIPGLATRADLIRTVSGQQRTIIALQDLNCDSDVKVPTVPGQAIPPQNDP